MTDGNGSSARKMLIVIMMGIILAGAAAGTAAYSKMSGEMLTAMSAMIPSADQFGYGDAGIWETALRSFRVTAAFLLAVFLLGFGTVYQPLTAAVMLFRGIGIGTSMAHIYCTAAQGNGGAFLPAMFIPDAAAASLIIAAGAAESVMFSGQSARILFLSDGAVVRPQPDVRLYVLRFAVLFAAAVLWSLADGLICTAVSSYL